MLIDSSDPSGGNDGTNEPNKHHGICIRHSWDGSNCTGYLALEERPMLDVITGEGLLID